MPKRILEKNIRSFDNDANKFGGYVYTSSDKLSSVVSNRHISDIILNLAHSKQKRIIDVGCGDGTYTMEIYHRGKPKFIYGFDPSKKAIASAKKISKDKKNIRFSVENIYEFEPIEKYDIAIVRGVLHHLYYPKQALSQISKLAKKIVVAEPNGYNPLLKIIEKVSPYHRQHEEKSFPPFILDRWIEESGGKIKDKKLAGLVPFFCPDWLATFLKFIEPVVERLPVLNALLCASYYVIYETKSASAKVKNR